jgi:rubrerythrin
MLSKAIETAVKMETDAMRFYHEAAEKTKHPFAKRMFQGFVRDEDRHLKMLKEILSGMDLKIVTLHPKAEIRTVFSELKEQMMERVSASTDEIEAVQVALDFETKGFEFYKKAAADAADERERALFSALANEEQEHYSILQNTYSFLKDTGDWFMWQEQGILEG